MIIASLMYANGLKKLLEVMLFVAADNWYIRLDLLKERSRVESALEALKDIESPAKEVLERQLESNRLKSLENDRRRRDCLEMLKKAKVEATEEWFDRIRADHNSRINEGDFQRSWATA